MESYHRAPNWCVQIGLRSALILLLLTTTLGCSPKQAAVDSHSRPLDEEEDYQLVVHQGETRFGLQETEMGDRLLVHLEMMMAPEPSEERVERLLSLRADAAEVMSTVESALNALDESRYKERWMLVHFVGTLISPESIDLLAEQATAAVPPERLDPEVHSHVSTRGEEQMIRFAAIRGLTVLATEADETAGDRLVDVAQQTNDEAVRLFAVRRLLRVYQDAPAVLEILEEDDHWMVQDITDVPELEVAHPSDEDVATIFPDPSN